MNTSGLTDDDVMVLQVVKKWNDVPGPGKTKADGLTPCPSSEICRQFDAARQPPPVHSMRSMVVKQYLQTNAQGQRGLHYVITDLGRAKLAEAAPESKNRNTRTPDNPPQNPPADKPT